MIKCTHSFLSELTYLMSIVLSHIWLRDDIQSKKLRNIKIDRQIRKFVQRNWVEARSI